MSTPYTAADALSVYMTGGESDADLYLPSASIGGGRIAAEVPEIAWDFGESLVVPGIVIVKVAGACGTGEAQLRATSSTALAFTAPGGTEGTAVTIAVGETKTLIDGGSANKYIKVYRAGSNDLGGVMPLTLFYPQNTALAGPDVAPGETDPVYPALILRNENSAAMSGLKIWIAEQPTSPTYELMLEAVDAEGKIELQADLQTEPTGASWTAATSEGGALTLASLAASAEYGLRIKRTDAAGIDPSPGLQVTLRIKFTLSAVTYTRDVLASFAAAMGTAQFELRAGADELPDFGASPDATSATSPVTLALTPPMSGTRAYNLAVRYRDEYGLESVNQDVELFVIDSTGALVTPVISDPVEIDLRDWRNGQAWLTAKYMPAKDATPADTWRIYSTTDGTDPDPLTDTPLEVAMEAPLDWPAVMVLDQKLGPYEFGTDLRVLVRAYNSENDVESENSAVEQLTIGTAPALRPLWRAGLLGNVYEALSSTAYDEITYITGTSNGAYFRHLPGEAQFWADSKLVWRCVFDSLGEMILYIPSSWTLYDSAVSRTGTTAAIEAGSWTGGDKRLYINVDGQSRALVDVTNDVIQWGGLLNFGVTLLTHPNPSGGIWQHPDGTKTIFEVLDAATQTMKPYLQIDSSGNASTAITVDNFRS